MLKKYHVLTEYREIQEKELLPAARHVLGQLETELAALVDDAYDAIPSAIIHPLDGPETHGQGRASDPTTAAYWRLQGEMCRIRAHRLSLQSEIAEQRESIRRMESIVRCVDSWKAQVRARGVCVGDLPALKAVSRFIAGDSYDLIASAADTSEKTVRVWFVQVDRDIRQLMCPRVTLHHERRQRRYAPVSRRISSGFAGQQVLYC
jgi:hypothetical protein